MTIRTTAQLQYSPASIFCREPRGRVHSRLLTSPVGTRTHADARSNGKTTIATAAIQNLLGGDELMKRSRKPSIMADAAYAVLTRNSRNCNGNFFIDEQVLAEEGFTDLDDYAMVKGADLAPDFFV